jgi:hypothetical protein
MVGIKHWVGAAASPPVAGSSPFAPGTDSPGKTPGTDTGIPSPPPIPPEENNLYQDLINKTGGDRDLVERLIEFESKYAPNARRMELIRRAIERWLKDNR